MTEFPNQRPYAALIREGNGDYSRDQAAAAVALASNSIVQRRAAVDATVAGPATIVGTAVVNDAAVAGLDTYSLYISDGDDVEEISFAAAGINTLAEFKTALEALATVDATVDGTGHVTITGMDDKSVTVDASNAAVFAALGIAEGKTDPTVDTDAAPAGYVPYGTAGAIEGTAAYWPSATPAGGQGVVITDTATLKDALLVVDEDLKDAAFAELRENGLKVRTTLVLN